ncbi:hypothetical protein, partial [Klebsiella pneumoniae]|uniref:hypothetical protein n=1 Tax=Klebsiella pneumoniae TaxID=573 RepID=UPI0039C0FB17
SHWRGVQAAMPDQFCQLRAGVFVAVVVVAAGLCAWPGRWGARLSAAAPLSRSLRAVMGCGAPPWRS